MFNPTLKLRETLLFFLIVVINELICIDSDIGLDTCTKVEVEEGGSSHTTFVRLLYLGGDKSEKVYTGYKVQPTKGLNHFKESECRASVQKVLCIFYLQINNIQKYYSISLAFLPLLLCLHQHKQTTSIPVLYFQTSLISLPFFFFINDAQNHQ